LAAAHEPERKVLMPNHTVPRPSRTHLPELLFLLIGALIILGTVAFSVTDHGLALPYFALFITSLVAGTILPFLPGSSEMAMAGLLATDTGAPALLIATAIVGNIIGATANYLVGWNIARFSGHRWFPISPVALQRTTEWFQCYGIWLILICWLPTAGDAITIVAGLLRANLRVFLILATIGKTFGHTAVASGVSWIS
jgi:membrane protein YqaA with SNARE-associated domain